MKNTSRQADDSGSWWFCGNYFSMMRMASLVTVRFGTTVIVPVDNANYMYQYRFNCVEWENNTIVTSITAKAAQDRIPGLKPDDNPVVVEIKLKTP